MAVNMRKSIQKKSIAALLYTFDASLPDVVVAMMVMMMMIMVIAVITIIIRITNIPV